ncbi:MAG: pentapeptide repeat-containing protein [Candidatus Nanopelagicales bacterium]
MKVRLRGARLKRAQLRDARLRGARLRDARLRDAGCAAERPRHRRGEQRVAQGEDHGGHQRSGGDHVQAAFDDDRVSAVPMLGHAERGYGATQPIFGQIGSENG